MDTNKVQISKKEFDDIYEITEEIVVIPAVDASPEQDMPDKQNTTPEFLTDEEEAFDVQMHDTDLISQEEEEQ